MEAEMISDTTLRKIIDIFIGDNEEYYSYKRGSDLVEFFNSEFDFNDHYYSGFPSRWYYVLESLKKMMAIDRESDFFDLILSLNFLMKDNSITLVNAAERQKDIICEFNRILASEGYQLIKVNNSIELIKDDEELTRLGSGGYADVYYHSKAKVVIKRLQRGFISNAGIRSRFKREFEITRSLQDMDGIIHVYEFDEGACQYTMEYAECTLQDYIEKKKIDFESKEALVEQMLIIMTKVHSRGIIHRDLSPNNIFFCNGELCIADFGLGKDLNVLSSHQTLLTNQVGQIRYCAPEQFMLLREGDKRSDVFSLGRIINYIFTGSPADDSHPYRAIAEKATNPSAPYRFADAGQMLTFYRKSIQYHHDSENEARVFEKMRLGRFDDEVEDFVYEQTGERLSTSLKKRVQGFNKTLLMFMDIDDNHALHIVQSVNDSFRAVCGYTFEAYDPFAFFMKDVLHGNYCYSVKEIAAKVLRYVAYDVGRFDAQHYVEDLISDGVEPQLEDELRR